VAGDVEPGHSSASRIRVVHLAASLPVGGMELVVNNLARGLPRERFDCAVWCLQGLDRVGQELARDGFSVEDFAKRRQRDPALFVRLAWALRRRGAEILHCHDELSWFYGAGAAMLARGTKVVMTMHGRRANISARHVREQRWLAHRTSALIVVSGFLNDQVVTELGLERGQVRTILNGIPIPTTPPSTEQRRRARTLLGIDERDFLVGTVGELSPVKNLDLALEAIAHARQRVPALRYVLVGDGALRDTLQARCVALGIQEVVMFAGIRRDVPEILPALDAYLCSSRYEGISLSILEAMSHNVAIVATHVGGNPEVLAGDAGLLVPLGSASEMADAICALKSDASYRATLGDRARDAALVRFSLHRMINDYAGLYACLSGRPGAQVVT
jgi:glycosyltransferase involved in cell wall biosynthesis